MTRTPEPVSSIDSTFVEVSTLTPSFLYALASSADTSASSVGTMRSRYSTMVTSAPNWLSTYANSVPMAPEPPMMMDPGTVSERICSS